MTVLAVQDPFPPTAQVQPAPGNRLVAITYEVVSLSSTPRRLTDLPAIELRDAAGTAFRSEHGRLSMVAGSRIPGELPAGRSMEGTAVFEVAASATGLGVVIGSLAPDEQGAVVTLD